MQQNTKEIRLMVEELIAHHKDEIRVLEKNENVEIVFGLAADTTYYIESIKIPKEIKF